MNAPTLYGITAELNAILAAIEDNGGEITPEIENALAINEEQFATKAVDYGHAILNLKAMAAAAKAEKERIAALQKFYENTQKRLEGALSAAMQVFGQDKVENATMRLSLRHTMAVADDYDINKIPKAFRTEKLEITPDKASIKKYILDAAKKAEAEGKKIDTTAMNAVIKGVRLVENVLLQIK